MGEASSGQLIIQGIIVTVVGIALLGVGIGVVGAILGPYWILKGLWLNDSLRTLAQVIFGIIFWIIIILLVIEYSWAKWAFGGLLVLGVISYFGNDYFDKKEEERKEERRAKRLESQYLYQKRESSFPSPNAINSIYSTKPTQISQQFDITESDQVVVQSKSAIDQTIGNNNHRAGCGSIRNQGQFCRQCGKSF